MKKKMLFLKKQLITTLAVRKFGLNLQILASGEESGLTTLVLPSPGAVGLSCVGFSLATVYTTPYSRPPRPSDTIPFLPGSQSFALRDPSGTRHPTLDPSGDAPISSPSVSTSTQGLYQEKGRGANVDQAPRR